MSLGGRAIREKGQVLGGLWGLSSEQGLGELSKGHAAGHTQTGAASTLDTNATGLKSDEEAFMCQPKPQFHHTRGRPGVEVSVQLIKAICFML